MGEINNKLSYRVHHHFGVELKINNSHDGAYTGVGWISPKRETQKCFFNCILLIGFSNVQTIIMIFSEKKQKHVTLHSSTKRTKRQQNYRSQNVTNRHIETVSCFGFRVDSFRDLPSVAMQKLPLTAWKKDVKIMAASLSYMWPPYNLSNGKACSRVSTLITDLILRFKYHFCDEDFFFVFHKRSRLPLNQ